MAPMAKPKPSPFRGVMGSFSLMMPKAAVKTKLS